MANKTSIQWCDSTVNPIMGCNGCELYPETSEVLRAIDAAVAATGTQIDSKAMLAALVNDAFGRIREPLASHKKVVNNTNIWHLREQFASQVETQYGTAATCAVKATIRSTMSCYAARLHLNKGANLQDPERMPHKGHAAIFELVTPFPGRTANAANLSDLMGKSRSEAEWKGHLPRMIFVSDMGDAFSAQPHFEFLKADTVPQFQSAAGRRHLWLWLTKRPDTMARFSEEIGGFPENVCAMTTVTCAAPENLKRVDELRKVKAHIRGLSIEPLRERIPPESLNLEGIDWVIVGGESGAGDDTPAFDLQWAEELMEHCRRHGVAFFLKQLGRRPMRNGKFFKLKDAHGGSWDEWDEPLRVRKFPKAFHSYRAGEVAGISGDRPKRSANSRMPDPSSVLSADDASYLAEREKIVDAGLNSQLEVGSALREIRDYKGGALFKGSYGSIEGYCRQRWGIGKAQAYRLMGLSEVVETLKKEFSPNGRNNPVPMPSNERQVRPLTKLKNAGAQADAWLAVVQEAAGNRITGSGVDKAVRAAVKAGAELKSVPRRKRENPPEERPAAPTVNKADELARPKPSVKEIPGGTAEEIMQHLSAFLQGSVEDGRKQILRRELDRLIQAALKVGLLDAVPPPSQACMEGEPKLEDAA